MVCSTSSRYPLDHKYAAVETPPAGAVTVDEAPWPPFMIDGKYETGIEPDYQTPHTEPQRGPAPLDLPIPDPERDRRQEAAASPPYLTLMALVMVIVIGMSMP